jgi:hypothetical protein
MAQNEVYSKIQGSTINTAAETKAILNDVKHVADGRAIIFTVEKTLIVDAASNRRNDGWIDSDTQTCPACVKYIKTTKDPVSAMMLRIVAPDCQKMHPVSLPAGVKVNIEDYICTWIF